MEIFRNFRVIIGNLAGRLWPDEGDGAGAGVGVGAGAGPGGPVQGQAPIQPRFVPAPGDLPAFRGRRRSADWEVMLQEGVRMDTYEPGRNRRSRRVSRPPVRYQA